MAGYLFLDRRTGISRLLDSIFFLEPFLPFLSPLEILQELNNVEVQLAVE